MPIAGRPSASTTAPRTAPPSSPPASPRPRFNSSSPPFFPPATRSNSPSTVTIQTFTAGGQLVIRHYRHATFFVRPVLAAFHINGTPHPNDPVNTIVAEILAPQGHLTDWYGAYGAGGGAELPLMKHLGARVQFDAGWNHPFTNILGKGAWTYRYSIGPAFHFGHNIAH